MQLLFVLGALAILVIAGALCFVLVNARRLKQRHLRVLRAQLSSLEELGAFRAPLFSSSAALFHGTRFADGSRFLEPPWAAPCVGELWCSDRALFLLREPEAAEEKSSETSPEKSSETSPAHSQAPLIGPSMSAAERARTMAWPLEEIREASLQRGFAPLAGKDLPLLGLRFVRGGEELICTLSLRGGMEQLERLRKEIHLRQERGAMLVKLGTLGKLP